MKILLLEPFFGGSHKQWAEGFQKHSKHKVEILSLPARRWKWRMHGGAITLAENYKEKYSSNEDSPDVILASDMLDLTIFQSLTKKETANIPTALFFHENQMSYPVSSRDSDTSNKRDLHYGFINIVSALAADTVFFNSDFHKKVFLEESKVLLSRFSKKEANEYLKRIFNKSSTLYVGIDTDSLKTQEVIKGNKPLIAWNHRWEFDKNPELFFETLFKLKDLNIEFDLVVLGEQSKKAPDIFETAQSKLSEHILHWGYADSIEEYAMWLQKADILPVTSNQEFFGVSVCEAILCGCLPLLPKRLSYPELLPKEFHEMLLYQDENELLVKLKKAITDPISHSVIAELKTSFQRFDWKQVVKKYDRSLEELVERGR